MCNRHLSFFSNRPDIMQGNAVVLVGAQSDYDGKDQNKA